MAFTMT